VGSGRETSNSSTPFARTAAAPKSSTLTVPSSATRRRLRGWRRTRQLNQHDVAHLATGAPGELRTVARPVEGRDVAGSETRQPSRRTAIKPLRPDIGNAVGAVDVRDRSAVWGPAHGASAMRVRAIVTTLK